MKRRILITGGSGLLALNWAVSVRNDYTVTLGLNERQVSVEGLQTIKLDNSSYDSLLTDIVALQPDLIIHTAGLTSVEACEQDPGLAYAVNVELAANIARVAAQLNARLVHISTDHLFTGDHPNAEESTPVAPVNVYGQTKFEAEQKVLENHPSALVIRTNFFGWGPGYRSSFSDTILHALRSGNEINLFTDVFFTPILIQSLVSAVHALLDKGGSGIFNVVGDQRISKYDFGMLLAGEFGLDQSRIRPIYFKNKPGLTKRPLDMSLSNRKACNALGKPLGDVATHLAILHELETDQGIACIRKL